MLPVSFEFSTFNPENLIHVENEAQRVLIHAAYDNFSPRRKSFLIRQLAAEGYIPDQYEHFSELAWDEGVVWVIDRSLIAIGPGVTRRSGRLMRRLLLGGCLLWVLELLVMFFWAR
jgi:hypothetical protein